jgi:hypothetical protein
MKREYQSSGKSSGRFISYLVPIALCLLSLMAIADQNPWATLDAGGGYSSTVSYRLESSVGQSSPIGESAAHCRILFTGYQLPEMPSTTLPSPILTIYQLGRCLTAPCDTNLCRLQLHWNDVCASYYVILSAGNPGDSYDSIATVQGNLQSWETCVCSSSPRAFFSVQAHW